MSRRNKLYCVKQNQDFLALGEERANKISYAVQNKENGLDIINQNPRNPSQASLAMLCLASADEGIGVWNIWRLWRAGGKYVTVPESGAPEK